MTWPSSTEMSPTVAVCEIVTSLSYFGLELPCLLACFPVLLGFGFHLFLEPFRSLFRVLLPALLVRMSVRSTVLALLSLSLFGSHG